MHVADENELVQVSGHLLQTEPKLQYLVGTLAHMSHVSPTVEIVALTAGEKHKIML